MLSNTWMGMGNRFISNIAGLYRGPPQTKLRFMVGEATTFFF
jgi:hypothetical protein